MLIEIKLITQYKESPVHLKETMTLEMFKTIIEEPTMATQLLQRMLSQIERLERAGPESKGDYTDYNYHPG